MKSLLVFGLVLGSQLSFAESVPVAKFETARNISKVMKSSIEAKDAPATCWILGRVHGYALAMKQLGDTRAAKLVEFVDKGAGKCGGKNTLNLQETFTQEEWTRLSELQKQIENFN
ncbi:hypothetical protein B9G69_010590 [Bdellovibrio sp. SKB1291214]|uniref:hypothetical protein n=1 Tax=Bdellovibrio sp. SKB1291214 TaxID=1732569 RepID=UPI000B51CB03|nr:hypothetical protein [Bdellovibrio sp. SKB1291214]UYL07491.1 hypothetical protein B9G69_010590 [Bdellovibrio sp. SKB1291214]